MDFVNFLSQLGQNVNKGVQSVERGVADTARQVVAPQANPLNSLLGLAAPRAGAAMAQAAAQHAGPSPDVIARSHALQNQILNTMNFPSPNGQIPVGQPLTQQNINALPQNIQGMAQIYNQNPMDPRVAHVDPAIFGYAPDGPPQFQSAVPVFRGHSTLQNGITRY